MGFVLIVLSWLLSVNYYHCPRVYLGRECAESTNRLNIFFNENPFMMKSVIWPSFLAYISSTIANCRPPEKNISHCPCSKSRVMFRQAKANVKCLKKISVFINRFIRKRFVHFVRKTNISWFKGIYSTSNFYISNEQYEISVVTWCLATFVKAVWSLS